MARTIIVNRSGGGGGASTDAQLTLTNQSYSGNLSGAITQEDANDLFDAFSAGGGAWDKMIVLEQDYSITNEGGGTGFPSVWQSDVIEAGAYVVEGACIVDNNGQNIGVRHDVATISESSTTRQSCSDIYGAQTGNINYGRYYNSRITAADNATLKKLDVLGSQAQGFVSGFYAVITQADSFRLSIGLAQQVVDAVNPVFVRKGTQFLIKKLA